MATLRLSDLTAGTLCRIGITLSSYFWLPVSVLLGIAGATDALAVVGLAGQGGLIGFVSGFLHGIASSIAMDAALVLGVLSYAVARAAWGAIDYRLNQR